MIERKLIMFLNLLLILIGFSACIADVKIGEINSLTNTENKYQEIA